MLAAIVGIFLWCFASAFSRTGFRELLLFFEPIVFYIGPLALRAFRRNRVLTGMWMLALAPILGFINFFVAIQLATTGGFGESVVWILALAWGLLLVLRLVGLRWSDQTAN